MLQHQIRQHEERREHLNGNQGKFDRVPDPDEPAFGDYMVLMGAIMREEMTIEWMKKCLDYCTDSA